MENKNVDVQSFLPTTNSKIKLENNEVIVPMSKDEAYQLTNDIKSTTTALYVLLKRAHDTKAWSSLGYSSWTEYIENEFDFSRARSYQLINQAQVLEEIHEASGVEVYLTEKEARDIKKRLPELTEKLKEIKTLELEDEDAEEEVKKVVSQNRYNEKEEDDNYDSGEQDASDVDRARDFEAKKDKEQRFEREDDDDRGYLTNEEEFIYEFFKKAIITVNKLPEYSKVSEVINLVHEEKQLMLEQSKKALEWLSNLIEEIED